MPVVLSVGLDVGSTSTKAALVAIDTERAPGDGSGVRELGVLSAPTPDDATALVVIAAAMISRLTSSAPGRVAAMGIASMAETGVPLDGQDSPLRPLVRWDRRADTDRDIPDLFAHTGVPSTPKPPLVAWLAEDFGMARWAGVADMVALGLTGVLVTDHTLAGRTMAYRLPAPGSPLAARFDADLLAPANLRPGQLPDVVLPGEGWPRVTPGGSSLSGLRTGTPVVIAGHDHAVGAWGAGVRSPGETVDSIGTTEVIMTVADGGVDRSAAHAAGMSVVRTVEGDREALLAGSASAGSAVRSWVDREYDGSFDAMMADLDRVPERGGTLVLPYLGGRQSPIPDPAATFRILDGGSDPRAARTAALFDALAFHARWMLDVQADLTGRASTAVTVLGSAALGNGAWMDAKAAIMPPMRVVEATEPVATSAAVLAAVRAGEVDALTRLPTRVVPRPPLDLETRYHRFVAAATSPVPTA